MQARKRRIGGLQLKAGGNLLLLLLLNSVILGTAIYTSKSLKGNARAINLAGSLRYRSFEIAFLLTQNLHNLEKKDNEKAALGERLSQRMGEFQRLIYGLRDGDRELGLAPARDPAVFQALDKNIRDWSAEFFPAITSSLASPRLSPNLIGVLEELVTSYVASIDGTVRLMEATTERRVQVYENLQYAFLALTLAMAALGAYLVHRLIQRPALGILKGMEQIAAGDLSRRINVRSRDEMGELAQGFNLMAARLEELYTGMEQKVAERTAELETATRHKSEFLANMSHELRTPLNSIIGFSELLEDQTFGPLNEKQRQYVQNVLAGGRHLLSLINDILDLSKVEAGKMELRPEEFSLSEALPSMVAMVQTQAAKKEIRLEVNQEPGIAHLIADLGKVKQIMYNLLSNAIKFTPEKGRVRAEVKSQGDMALISVSDTGIGIRKEDQEKIFEEFQQLESGLARRHEGTGLGLALTKRLVELHGGTIWVESQPGQGSTFFFTLPALQEQAGLPLAGAEGKGVRRDGPAS